MSGQLCNVFWRQRYPGLVETDWHGVLLDVVTVHAAHDSRHFLSRRRFHDEDGMQIVKFEDFPSTSLVQCYLKYPIVTATDVEQDIVSFD